MASIRYLHHLIAWVVILSVILSACAPQALKTEPAPTASATPREPAAPTPTPIPTVTPVSPPTPVPPAYLSDLTPLSAAVGFGALGVGQYALPDAPDFDGRPISAHGKPYPHGLMAHAPSHLIYTLAEPYRALQADLLIQDELDCGDGVTFRIFVDGIERYSSPTITAHSQIVSIRADLFSGRVLELIADPGDGGDCDWAIWGDAVLVSAEEPGQSLSTPTPDPDLPCSGSQEHVYLFLDCSDIRRIREQLGAGDPEYLRLWGDLRDSTDDYRGSFPTEYNPDRSYPALWWGVGNNIARHLGLLYLVTGKPEYARDMIRLLDLVRRNTPLTKDLYHFNMKTPDGDEFSGGLMSHPQYGGIVFQSVLFGYLAVRETVLLDDAQRQSDDQFLIHQAELLEQAAIMQANNTPINSSDNRNAPFGANLAAITIALAFKADPAMDALYARLRERVDWQLANWWEQDGGWGENTHHYGYRTFEEVLVFAETLEKLTGEALYTRDFGGHSIHTLCMYFQKVLVPEGDTLPINDTSFLFVDPGTLLLCSKRTGDPLLMFAAQQYLWGYEHGYQTGARGSFPLFDTLIWWDPAITQDQPPPSWTSSVLPSTGLAMMRSNWSHEAQLGGLKYTASRVHNDYSFGEFFLYDHGPWLTGNGYHLANNEYERSIHTASHSTLTLDNLQQTQVGGELAGFAALGNTGWMAVTSQSYPGLRHTRTVFWNRADHQWIVVDDASLQSPAGHKLQDRWYVRGKEDAHNDQGNWVFTRMDGSPGFLSIQFRSPLHGTYSWIYRSYADSLGDARGIAYEVTPVNNLTRLVTALTYMEEKPVDPPVVSRDDSGTGLLVTVDNGPASPTWTWALPDPGSQIAETGGIRLEGAAGCTWQAPASLEGYCLYQGTSLANQDTTLITSDAPLSIEVDFKTGQVYLDAPTALTVSMRWVSPVHALVEANQPHDYESDEGLLTIHVEQGTHILTARSGEAER